MNGIHKSLIHVTHFLNPHHFYYKYENDIFDEELNELEYKIQLHALRWRKTKTENIKANIGEIVAAYNITWNKWFRAKVYDIIQDDCEIIKYKVWAIDHGTPHEIITSWLTPLPIELAENGVKHIHEGAIINYMPAERTFDVDQMKVCTVRSKEWSDVVIKTIQDIISDNANLLFETILIENSTHFGNLTIHTYSGNSVTLGKVFEQIHGGMYIENFVDEIFKITLRNKQTQKKLQNHNDSGSEIDFEIISNISSSQKSNDDRNISTKKIESINRNANRNNNKSNDNLSRDEIDYGMSELCITGETITNRTKELTKGLPRLPNLPRPPPSASGSTLSDYSIDEETFKVIRQKLSGSEIRDGTRDRTSINQSHIPSGYERDVKSFLQNNPKKR